MIAYLCSEENSVLPTDETSGLILRDVHCPDCHFIILKVFSDAVGHYLSKCPKCKSQHVMNLSLV